MTKRLSACFFSHLSLLGGAQLSLIELVSELSRERGVACTVVLSDEGPLRPRLEAVGARTLLASYFWWGQKDVLPEELEARLVPSMTALLKDVMPELVRIAPDVVVTNTLVIPWGAVAAALLSRPHVWNACEFGPRDSSLTFFAPPDEILKAIRSSSNRVLVPSESVRRELFADMPEGFAVNIGRFVEIPREALAAPAPEPPARPGTARLGLFATLTPDKGQAIALSALAELLRRGRDVELVLVGTPTEPFAAEIFRRIDEEGLSNRARVLGYLDNPYPAMAQTDIVVAPFRQDAFARVVLEAMLLGKPVVASDAGALASLVRDGFNGFLVPHGDAARLADRVEDLLDRPEKAATMGENGRRFVRETFSRETFGGRAYETLAAVKGAPAAPFPDLLLPFLRQAVSDLESGGTAA